MPTDRGGTTVAADQADREQTAYAPCSKKGEVRTRIATVLMKDVNNGALRAIIARSADFYGPGAGSGVANVLVFEPLPKGRMRSVLLNASMPGS